MNCAALAPRAHHHAHVEKWRFVFIGVWCLPRPSLETHLSISNIAWNKDLDGLRKAFAEGADPNEVKYDEPVVFGTIEKGWIEGLEAFIAAGVDLNLKSEREDTVLIRAVIHKSPEAAKVLVAAGADMTIQNKIGFPPLNYVVRMNAGSSVTITTTSTDADGNTTTTTTPPDEPQQRAMAVARILLDGGADINLPNSEGWLSLHHAASAGALGWCELLLDHGAAATSAKADGYSVLHSAAGSSRTEAAKLLLSRGADPNAVDAQGYSPLHEAVLATSEDVVRVLLEAGADKSLQVKEGWDVVKPGMTAKDIAVAKSLDGIVALLS